PFLEAELCTLVGPGTSIRDLRVALRGIAHGKALRPPATVRDLFAACAPPLPGGSSPHLTPREIQCGCAISLGLTNHQISETLHVGLSTLKGHIGHLMRKLALTDREDVALYFERALGSSSSTFGMGN